MTDHPITPPSELREQWLNLPVSFEESLEIAAHWGADQELDACCEWANATGWEGAGDSLRAARRPKPPLLKEQLKKLLNQVPGPGADAAVLRNWADRQSSDLIEVIRSALEALPDD